MTRFGLVGAITVTVLAPAARAQLTLPALTVAAERGALAPDEAAVATVRFDAARLNEFSSVTLDDTLRQDPSFSLFRRTSSLTSNPTSQGVSLREIGPSGASRSLVVLDGIPLNDPFGGWVVWSAVPQLILGRADLVKGGGSAAWGNQALAGTITLATVPPAAGGGRVAASAGAFGTRSGEAAAGQALGAGEVAVDLRSFSTDGYYNLGEAARGAVDRPFDSRHALAQMELREPWGSQLQILATGRIFAEHRGNGTALQNNDSHLAEGALELLGDPSSDLAWSATGYVERESFSSFFSSVSADRATETPANNQFDVPATAVGSALTAQWKDAGGVTVAGADVRQVIGETREDFQYAAGAFSRVRFAGGAQDFAGAFLRRDERLGEAWRITADLRADEWWNREGHDREYNLANGAPTLLAVDPDRRGGELSPSLGATWRPAPDWRVHAAAYRGFRLPTLNEFYRPFRVGTVATNANPNLRPESLEGGEAGVEYRAGGLRIGITGFADALTDAVGTVVISQTPTATTVQRSNLDAVRVQGAEASLSWEAGAFRLRAGWLANDSRILRVAAEPDLVGLRLPEVPRNTVTASAAWTGPAGSRVELRERWVGMQFDDNANTLRLPAAGVTDLEVSRRWGRRCEVWAAAENLGDTAVATSLSGVGLTTYDAPRLLRGGVRLDW